MKRISYWALPVVALLAAMIYLMPVHAQTSDEVNAKAQKINDQSQRMLAEQAERFKRTEELLARQEQAFKRSEALLLRQEQISDKQDSASKRFDKILDTWERQQKEYQKYLDSLPKK